LGSVSRETDSSGSTTSTKTYDAFGNLESSTGSSSSPFGFAGSWGYQSDSDSGLMLLGHRYYDSSSGRFLTRDPAQDGRNWYGYCDGNPLMLIDPTGRWDWGAYWRDEGRVWKGVGESALGVVTGPIQTARDFFGGGWRDPVGFPLKETWKGLKGTWNDLGQAWNGDPEAFGRVDGGVLVATGTAMAGAALASAALGGAGDGMAAADRPSIPTPRRLSTAQLKRGWSDEFGYEWPAHPTEGECIAHHAVPLGDGGPDTVENIMPVSKGVHNHLHSGDWARWGAAARRSTGSKS